MWHLSRFLQFAVHDHAFFVPKLDLGAVTAAEYQGLDYMLVLVRLRSMPSCYRYCLANITFDKQRNTVFFFWPCARLTPRLSSRSVCSDLPLPPDCRPIGQATSAVSRQDSEGDVLLASKELLAAYCLMMSLFIGLSRRCGYQVTDTAEGTNREPVVRSWRWRGVVATAVLVPHGAA